MIEILNGLVTDVQSIVLALVTLMAIAFVVMTWVSTKSLVPVLGAVLLGALVIYGVNNYDFLQQKVEQDFEQRGTP
jgi:xanthine/uracil permease